MGKIADSEEIKIEACKTKAEEESHDILDALDRVPPDPPQWAGDFEDQEGRRQRLGVLLPWKGR